MSVSESRALRTGSRPAPGLCSSEHLARRGRARIAHVDTATGQTALWEPALGDYCSEPIFIERHAAAAEGDGWLLSVVSRG
ncbi:MAG TPA: carotenoid oxygenase family protein [Burkholderiaceae bacterium]|nr:carotenoid oxygenase family protein [Burkholderiaceae bacterium]